MWKKLQILNKNTPEYKHNGFLFNTENNVITNLDKSFCIRLPYKIQNHSNLYSFELLFNDNSVIIYFNINIKKLYNIVLDNQIIPDKNNLFNVLKQYKRKKINNRNFREASNIKQIIDNVEIIQNYDDNILFLGNLVFDLLSESIIPKNQYQYKMKALDLYFYFSNPNIHKDYIIFIKPNHKYDPTNTEKMMVINKKNHNKITKQSILENSVICVDKVFFFSSLYVQEYKKFHNKSNTVYAYNNFKTHIINQSPDVLTSNVELFDNFVYLFNNIEPFDLINHPVLYSNSKKIFIFNKLNPYNLNVCDNFCIEYSKIKHNSELVCKTYLKGYYIDSEKSHVYRLLENQKDINFNNFNFNINTKYIITYFPIEEFCYINYQNIGFNCHVRLDCGHAYISTNIDLFINKINICPVCQTKTENLIIYVNANNILKDLLGVEFEHVYNQYPDFKHIVFGKYSSRFKKIINQFYKKIIFTENLNHSLFTNKSILYYKIDPTFNLLNLSGNRLIDNLHSVYRII